MSILLADIDATCSILGFHDGNKYYAEKDALQSLKHLVWILRRDNGDSHEYRRYIGHKKVIQTDLLPMLVNYCDDSELFDVLLRLLVNLTSPTLLFFREDLPKDGAGRRTYLDLVEVSQSVKEMFARSLEVWETLAEKLQKIMEIDVGDRLEEQSLVLERILVLTRNVLQVPSNPQHEKRVDNDISIHDKILWSMQESGMFDLILFILSSEYENQFQLHALEITHLIFREQKVETLADASVQRTAAEKHADEQALIAARRMEKAKTQQRPPPARHSRFGGTYVYKNLKSVSDRDLICHQSLERVVERDFNRDKQKVKSNFRLARDDDKFERQSAFCIRVALREFCIEILTSAFNNMVRQVRRVLERHLGLSEGSGHDQSYLLWAMKFFLEFNRLNGFKLDLVSDALSSGSIHWICNQIQNDSEMIQTDKKKKIKWNRRLQLGIQAYREFLHCLQAMELEEDEDTQALLAKLKNDMFYVVEYREIVLQLLLSYNENHFTRNYLRDLIDTTNVYLKMMENFCQGSIVVQTKVKTKKKKKVTKQKQPSKEEVLAKLENEWDARVSANLSVVLANVINLPEEEHPVPLDTTSEKPLDEQRGDCMTRLCKLLRDEDFERAVLLMRAGRECYPDSECFGIENAQPEDELMLMKEIYLTDLETENDENEGENLFWEDLDNSGSDGGGSDDEEESTAFKEIILNFSDFEKRLLNPKVIRACTWCLQAWDKMNYREIKSAVTLLHRIAVNLDVPVMLMQAQLFRVFQQVFNAPRDDRYEELRRLGTFVVRKFVNMAPANPKIFAELLFFKSHRDCFEIANGYTESLGGHEAKQKAWSEEQEEELRRLFMQNQESPENDQDVIDWIVDNLTEKSRSRRGVIKKLKELGLIFRAPTKKSSAAAANKNLFIKDEDNKLRELYDEHRLESDCLRRIMEVFNKKRSKKVVVRRMVQLGLIADESEILPARKQRNQREREEGNSGESSDSDGGGSPIRPLPKRQLAAKYQMNQREVESLRTELEESLKEAIDWIIESLKEAAEDFEEASDDPDDAIPIVPFSDSQKAALENSQFQKLLIGVNLLEPREQETYWKIPANMIPVELNQRAKILAGEEIVAEAIEAENSSDNDDEDEDFFSRLRAQHDALIYNRSDNEDERSAPLKKALKKVEKVGKPNTKTVQQLLPKVVDKHVDALKWVITTLNDKARNRSSDALDEMLLVASTESHRTALTDENFTKILLALNMIRPDGIESYWRIPASLTTKEILDRAKLLELNEGSSDDEDQQIVIKRKRKSHNEGLEMNTQQLKKRLAELEDSSDEDVNESVIKSKKNVLESSNEEEEADQPTGNRKSGKRDRSEIGDDTPDENEMNATNNQLKRIRRIADSSDDE